jgi:putative hydrolase of the HAD superfamily
MYFVEYLWNLRMIDSATMLHIYSIIGSNYMATIQAVFFDLGDTLTKTSSSVENEICKRIGEARGTPLQVEEYTRICRDEWLRRSSSKATDSVKDIRVDAEGRERQYWENYFESLLPFLGINTKQPKLIEWLVDIYIDPESYICFEEVYALLAELKEKGLILGIISNALPSADKVLDHLHLKQYFKYIFLSFELQYAKPDIKLYQFAAQKAGIPIESIMFIDDRWSFVKGAQEANMNALLIEREVDTSSKMLTKSLVRRIKNLKELLGILNVSPAEEVNRIREQSPSPRKHQDEWWNLCELSTNNSSMPVNEEMNYVGRTISANLYSISK